MGKIIYSTQLKYLENLRKDENSLILKMESFAKEHNIPILNWLAANFLEQLILMQNPKRVLEIGTAIGYSTIKVARNLKKKAFIDTIEKSKENIKTAKENFKHSKFESKINLLEGEAFEIMPNLDKKYDFIFLDADKEDYEKLFYYSIMLLKKGGTIFIDNLLWQGYTASHKVPPKYKDSTKHIREFNKLFASQSSMYTTILPIGDGIGIGIKVK